jgi:hypothetical protein
MSRNPPRPAAQSLRRAVKLELSGEQELNGMGQNNDTTEHGDLQGNQGGNLSKDPKHHERLRQAEEGYARAPDDQKVERPQSRRPRA